MQDLWYGLMLESYNDCAYAIAEHVAGSAEKFAALMNEKSKEDRVHRQPFCDTERSGCKG